MSSSSKLIHVVAPPPSINVLNNLEVLQNLASLIEQRVEYPKETREYVRTLKIVLDNLSRHILASTKLPGPN